MRLLRPAVLLVSFALPLVAAAVSFKDVPSTYPYKEAIDRLSDRGVITGNPDGTFRPVEPVNRAAMLKMLYVAANITPLVTQAPCFSDIPRDAWFASYVCDAVRRGYVKGYDDGKFWPSRPVTRAEALKLTTVILPPARLMSKTLVYADVASGDWFATYVQTAVSMGVLPLSADRGDQLHPSWPLERGEAASFIWSALSVAQTQEASSSSAAQVSSAASSVQRSAASSSEPDRVTDTKIPFVDRGTFSGKKPVSYRFTVDKATLFDAAVSLEGTSGGLVCRLYEIADDGFSSKYYLGVQEGGNCYLRAALEPGDYQLQLQPTKENISYSLVSTVGGASDGNDGFSQAKELLVGKVKVDFLDGNDLVDFYSFSVYPDAKVNEAGGRKMTLTVVSTPAADCLIYPLADVDLYGFSGPECGKEYLFPAGSYVVAVRHPSPRAAKVGYSIQLR